MSPPDYPKGGGTVTHVREGCGEGRAWQAVGGYLDPPRRDGGIIWVLKRWHVLSAGEARRKLFQDRIGMGSR